MNYTLIDENGANSIELEVIIPVKSFFLHEFGLYKVTHYSENQIFCERIFNYQFYEFYNELLEKYHIKLNKHGFIIVDMYNEPFNYERYLFDGHWENQELFKILNKYPALRELIYFEWKNVETAIICFDFNVI